jgi:inner membrane protein
MDALQETKNWMRNSITLKLFVIGILVLILLIPAKMAESLIFERSQNQSAVVNEVIQKWGLSQVITGPILTIPYKYNDKTAYAYFLPEKLDINGKVEPEIRNRGIYKVILYNAKLNMTGSFAMPDFSALSVDQILWDEAFLTIGIPDMRGIRKNIEIMWDNKNYPGNPGVTNKQIIESGINTRVDIEKDSKMHQFAFALDLNGSEKIDFVPLGKETHVFLQSGWGSPSFEGAFLPEKREVTQTGFKAEWNILHLNRNYPQQWTSFDVHDIRPSAFGVGLVMPVDHYQKSTRAAKYAIMFLFLTFLIFFINEVMNKSRIHPLQYLLIGLALVIFYILLISLSEYVNFNIAYAIASLAIIILITSYALGILGKRKAGWLIGLFLTCLYGFLFVLLQLEDYSLLLGSLGLFVILAIVMRVSRQIDWYPSQLQK